MSGRITVCGLGPGGRSDVTAATLEAISASDVRFLRTERHPTADIVTGGTTFDDLYDRGADLDTVYRTIADELASAATASDSVLYAVPGSPLVLERSVRYLMADERVEVDLVPALSFLDLAWARLGIDPVEEGVRLVDGHTFAEGAAGERGPMLVAHAHAPWVLSDIKLAIDAGPETTVVLLQGLGTDHELIVEVPWPDLDRSLPPDHLTSLYLPEVAAPVAVELERSVELMRRLRAECPWDQQQTHETLRRYLLEEAYEVLEAIDGVIAADGDDGAAYGHLEEELGDLWFQILFHAELATEAGRFTMADVARTVHDKLVGRHPHVFGDTEVGGADDVVANWEEIKREEKGRASVMDGIPATLPALTMAEKLLEKGSRSGVEPDTRLVTDIIDRGLGSAPDGDEVGRLLMAIVEQARVAGVDPEGALRAAAQTARRRFVEQEALGRPADGWVFG